MTENNNHLEKARLVLETVFGYDSFRGLQEAIIAHTLQGKNSLVLMPTGGGKSLCYQIPPLVSGGVGVVISPLIALMQDQVSALHQAGVRAGTLNSMQTVAETKAVEALLQGNELQLLYITPERLVLGRLLAFLKTVKVTLFAVDEAHCVSQWGHDFRESYLKLSVLSQHFPQVPIMALTATADPRTQQEIITRLAIDKGQVFKAGFDRPNIRYRILHKQQPHEQLLAFIQQEHRGDSGIIYCLSRKKVEKTASRLSSQGITALPYHAGMLPQDRQANQLRFLREEGLIMVATIAFGMGIDKPNVRFVAHLDLPKSIESYYQETGRAGRDGLPANAWMVYGLQDVVTLRQMVNQSLTLGDRQKQVERQKLDAMLALCEQIECRRMVLLAYFGEPVGKVGCNNCDTCLEPVETWDGTVAGQQALSCIYRTGQRFGVEYLVDVLRGKVNDRIKSFGHDKQSVFGLGVDRTRSQWRSIYRQLLARGLITVDLEGHGSYQLTERCRPVLRGETVLVLRKEHTVKQRYVGNTLNKGGAGRREKRLWDALRAKRWEIAAFQKVPPYQIFHDATLVQMKDQLPSNKEQFRQLSGVGDRKLGLYGDQFLAVIERFVKLSDDQQMTETVITTLDLFKAGLVIEAISEKRQITQDTVYAHLAEGLLTGEVELTEVVSISKQEISVIEQAILDVTDQQSQTLRGIYDALDGVYSYGIIRCVKAALQREMVA
ncbi:MAG TPA: DNA helicase RecQ [Methylococcaceae bacterium]|nr:DNA helicase RecQ [Methylococcaceae bacterium]HIL40369.1 DNA helicase RecQ [Methylococcales bacterium]